MATQEDDAGRVVKLGEIGRGEIIGEMSVSSGGTRTATVTALRDSRLVRISNQTFLEFMQRHPSVTRQFIQLLTNRLTNRAVRRQEKLSTLAPGRVADFESFVLTLRTALNALANVLVVDRHCIASACRLT